MTKDAFAGLHLSDQSPLPDPSRDESSKHNASSPGNARPNRVANAAASTPISASGLRNIRSVGISRTRFSESRYKRSVVSNARSVVLSTRKARGASLPASVFT